MEGGERTEPLFRQSSRWRVNPKNTLGLCHVVDMRAGPGQLGLRYDLQAVFESSGERMDDDVSIGLPRGYGIVDPSPPVF